MSLRGVKFQFEIGEPVICFEPDSTKARVLYNAKILELIVGRGPDGTRQAEYLVHFQGWNSSWDRVVPETLILPSTDENKDLMKLIANAARKIKTNQSRKRKIEILLKKHFRGHPDYVENASDDTEESEDSDESTDEEMDPEYADISTKCYSRKRFQQMTRVKDDFRNRLDKLSLHSLMRISIDGPRLCYFNPKPDNCVDQEVSFKDRIFLNGDDIVEKPQSDVEELEEVDPESKEVELELPENLKRKLEDDCYNICRKEKLVQLPASPNVIAVLEGYVKNFTANLMYSTVEKKLPRRERRARPLPQKNIELVKEVVDGLRVFFDFALPTKLLYSEEKEQFKEVINNYIHTPVTEERKETKEVEKPLKIDIGVTSPRLRSSSSKSTTETPASPLHTPPCSSPTIIGSTSPRAGRMSPRAGSWATKHKVCEDNILEVEELSSSPTRRLTRNIFTDFSRKRGLSDSSDITPTKEKSPKTEMTTKTVIVEFSEEIPTTNDSRRESLRSSGASRHTNGDIVSSSTRSLKRGGVDTITDELTTTTKGGDSLSDRVVPPPPLTINDGAAAAMSSKDSTTSSQNTPNPSSDSSSSMVFCNGYKTKEAALNHIYGWNLIPQEVYQSSPTPPSIVYGAHHLLRLFVKLPNLLGQMAIPENNYSNLIEHLEMFIDYMSERSEDLFPDTVYVNDT